MKRLGRAENDLFRGKGWITNLRREGAVSLGIGEGKEAAAYGMGVAHEGQKPQGKCEPPVHLP